MHKIRQSKVVFFFLIYDFYIKLLYHLCSVAFKNKIMDVLTCARNSSAESLGSANSCRVDLNSLLNEIRLLPFAVPPTVDNHRRRRMPVCPCPPVVTQPIQTKPFPIRGEYIPFIVSLYMC